MEKKPLLKKGLTISVILLFLGTGIIPSTAQDTEKPLPTSRGNWLYVGGNGPGNYTRIQDAINDSAPGDTVYVYNGTYYETVSINVMSLTLIGEDRETTVIDARPISSTAVLIQQSFVVIQGFTIIAADNFIYGNGILVSSGLERVKIYNNNLSKNYRGVDYDGGNNYDVIENNVFYSNFYGIRLWGGHNAIRNNTFVGNYEGIFFGGLYNEILNNTFLGCRSEGILQLGGLSTFKYNIFIGNDIGLDVNDGNTIFGNYFENNGIGLYAAGSGNTIIGNHFENNGIGLRLSVASDTVINQNNFINNRKDTSFSLESRSQGNTWDSNYWGRPRILPKPLLHIGILFWIIKPHYYRPGLPFFYFWLAFDWHPAQEPYDIPGMR